MKRVDILTVAVPGDFGKPRPALIIQNNDLAGIESTLVCLVTTSEQHIATFRFPLVPSAGNGLRANSVVMLDKIMVIWKAKCGPVIGSLNAGQMEEIDTRLALVIGLNR